MGFYSRWSTSHSLHTSDGTLGKAVTPQTTWMLQVPLGVLLERARAPLHLIWRGFLYAGTTLPMWCSSWSPHAPPTSLPPRYCSQGRLASGKWWGIGKRRGDDDPLWMWFSSGSHYGIHALLKAPFVSGEEVTVLNYTRESSGLSRSLVCFKTHKEASWQAFLSATRCLIAPALSCAGFVFPPARQCVLSSTRGRAFISCNRRHGSTLTMDKLIILFSEPLTRDKGKLTPQSFPARLT